MRLHLVDGTFELFRAHYAPRPPHIAPDGRDLKATVGVVRSLLALLRDKDEAATHVAVAFDNPIASFRNKLFDGYKTDEGIDPVLRSQFDEVELAVTAAGITVWRMVDFEADDALATAAARWADDPRVEQVRILTPDKDLGQMLQSTKVVQVDRIRKREITEASLLADKGFGPESIPDFLALVGDTADGIPGLTGWGEKSAASVLSSYTHIDLIPPDVSKWQVKLRGAAKLSHVLESHRDAARLYRTLATLRRDVPLSQSIDDLAWNGVSSDFGAWCARAGIHVPAMKETSS